MRAIRSSRLGPAPMIRPWIPHRPAGPVPLTPSSSVVRRRRGAPLAMVRRGASQLAGVDLDGGARPGRTHGPPVPHRDPGPPCLVGPHAPGVVFATPDPLRRSRGLRGQDAAREAEPGQTIVLAGPAWPCPGTEGGGSAWSLRPDRRRAAGLIRTGGRPDNPRSSPRSRLKSSRTGRSLARSHPGRRPGLAERTVLAGGRLSEEDSPGCAPPRWSCSTPTVLELVGHRRNAGPGGRCR